MSRYNDDYDPYGDMYDDDDEGGYYQWQREDAFDGDWLFDDDDPSQDDYYDDAPLTWLDQLQNKWHWLVWRVEYFWKYTLNMHRCPDCKKIYRFGDHSDCVPF